MESVSEKTERNTPEDKFNSRVLNEKPTTEEPEKGVEGIDETLGAVAELHTRTIIIKENGREEKRPKLENLPDIEDQERVDMKSINEGKENNITVETNIEQSLKPEEERDQEKQQIFENKVIKSEEEIKDTTMQTIDLVSQETGEKEVDIQTIDNEVELTKEDTQKNLGKDEKTKKDVISDTSNAIGTSEAIDVAQKAVENNAKDAQSNDGKEMVEAGQELASKPMEGPEVGGTEEVSLREIVETNEIDQKSIEGKGEKELISSSENIVETTEEPRTNEVEITESSSTEEIEVRSAVIHTDQKASGSETQDAHEATTQTDTEQKEIPCEVPIKTEPDVTATSQPSEPQPVPIPSININSDGAENKEEIGALSKTETMLLPESETQKENDTDSGTGSTADNSSIDLNLSISSFLSKTKDSGSISLQVSVHESLFGFFFVILVI